jgi:hypothetical protein
MLYHADDYRSLPKKSTPAAMRAAIFRFALALLLCGAPALFGQALIPNHHEVKYVILMVPDGMNLSA